MARLSGPITGGAHGWPIGATLRDFAAIGYAEEEFFIEGEAAHEARPSASMAAGRWRRSLNFRSRPAYLCGAPRPGSFQRNGAPCLEQRLHGV
jgi:hypothetical protein